LVDPVWHDFEQAELHVEDRLPLQRGMDRLDLLAREQEVVGPDVPGNVTGLSHDLPIRRSGQEAPVRLGEVALILEGQPSFRRRAHGRRR